LLALSVILFLVDVRLIFTEEGYRNLYYASVFFVLGIVAVNRLVAQEGATDSFLYVFGFGMVVFIYSAATMPEIRGGEGSALGGWGPVFFNVLLAALVWWTTNRLVHECCVDENRTAGDIGILTGTADLLRKGVAQRQDKNFFEKNIEGSVFPDTDLAPYDPAQWQPTEFKGRHKVGMADKLSRRHPGISIIIFTAFVMAIFALGQRALVAGGPAMDLKGMMYVVTYTGVALILLMLSSLSGLREFFRNRYIVIPPGIGPFWVGLGTVMVGAVILGALAFPMPSNPPVPYIEHKFDPYSRTIILRQLETVQTSAADQIMQNQVMFWSGRVVLIMLGLLCCYGFLRVVGFFAADIVTKQH